jgi:uncharacterized membrane protein YeaQ/YmgE (transglycosylase-associated protein family)
MKQWVGEGITIIIVGIVVGGLARILLPGAQRIGVFLTIIAGTVAALAGHFIAEQFEWGQSDGTFPNWPKLGIQVVLAMVVVGLIGGVGGRRDY